MRVHDHVEAFGQPRHLQRIPRAPVLRVRDDGDEESPTFYLGNHTRGFGVAAAPDVALGVRRLDAPDETFARRLVQPESAVHRPESPVAPALVNDARSEEHT